MIHVVSRVKTSTVESDRNVTPGVPNMKRLAETLLKCGPKTNQFKLNQIIFSCPINTSTCV